jgi:predicted acetyltransferase
MEQTEGTLWRIVDVVPALMGRCYPGGANYPSCSLQMTVQDDDLAPWNNGTFLIIIDGDGFANVEKFPDSASGEQCTAPAISLGIKALASLWSGFRSAVTLSAWGLLQAESEEALWLTNAVFATQKAPHVINHF